MVIERARAVRKMLGVGILSRAIFSVCLAILLWGWVTNLDDPEVDRPFPNVPLTVVGKAADLVILDESSLPTITAVLRGPGSALADLSAASLRATADLSAIKEPGRHEIDVEVTMPGGPRTVRLASRTPARVAITLDRLTSKTFALEVDKGPAVPPYSVGTVAPQTSQVEVRGPASLVGRVARVVLPVALGDRRANFEAQFTPEARDAAGGRVAGVTIEPGSVVAAVAVERVGRTVSIVPTIRGEPADGYRVRDTSVSPPSVTVDGPADLLAPLIVISTAPIDVGGRRESFPVLDVPLVLPAGVRLVDRTPINVEIRIEAEQQRQQVNVRVTALADPGLRVTLTPPEIVVVLSGSRDRLSQLRADDVKAELDLRGYTPNTYVLAPRLTVPADLRADPAPTVRVQIDRPATPTATPTPPPTPTPAPPPPTPAPSGQRREEPIAVIRSRGDW